jgi:DNA repair photolyase
LGEACWLNFTLETDREDVRRALTPRCPSIKQRLATLRAAQQADLQVQITVSPCLPYSNVEQFGRILLEHGDRVIVDSYVSGDGQQGKRTAATSVAQIYDTQHWGDWRAETAAQELYTWLRARIGERANWSQAGFVALATGNAEPAPPSA